MAAVHPRVSVAATSAFAVTAGRGPGVAQNSKRTATLECNPSTLSNEQRATEGKQKKP